jgi:hypothetical protein
MERDEFAELRHALTQGWNLPATPAAPEWEDLRAALARRVAHLLRHDMQRLVSAMYLLDVSEARFNAAHGAGSVDESARRLADVILEREAEKLASRRAYRRERSGKELPGMDTDERGWNTPQMDTDSHR